MKIRASSLLMAVTLVLVVGAGCSWPGARKPAVPAPVACTKEARLCPDGSTVGRTGPNCEFAPCPGTSPSCPDVCAAICAGDAEPDVPPGCPMPMCYCEPPMQ